MFYMRNAHTEQQLRLNQWQVKSVESCVLNCAMLYVGGLDRHNRFSTFDIEPLCRMC